MAQLSEGMLSALNSLYRHELTNHLHYTQFRAWASFRGLTGAEKWFTAQAAGEAGHAERVLAYLIERNEAPEPAPFAFDAPLQDIAFADIFAAVLELERGTTAAWSACYAAAMAEGDYLTCQWLMEPGGLLAEQREEEQIAQTIVDRIAQRGQDTAAVHNIDVWLGGL
jgi:ferritin